MPVRGRDWRDGAPERGGQVGPGGLGGFAGTVPGIGLDAFVVMPNHIHGIIVIDGAVGVPLVGTLDDDHARVAGEERATTRVAPTGRGNDAEGMPGREEAATRVAPALGDVVGGYKSIVTVEYARGVTANGWRPFRGRLWQRNYYERVIRDERELDRAREYIVGNPQKWDLDRENPNAAPAGTSWETS